MPRGSRRTHLPTQQEPFTDADKAGRILSDMLPLLTTTEREREILPAYDKPDVLEQTIMDYFRYCSDHSLRPGIIGLLAVVGLSYQEYRNEKDGLSHGLSCTNLKIIQKAHKVIEAYIEQTAAAGVLNPVLSIFWMKNYTGLRDSSDITVTPKTDIQATKSLEQIERDIPIDE